MSRYIEPVDNISEAWLRTLEAVKEAGGHAINVITTVKDPLAAEDVQIREAIDLLMSEGDRGGTRVQSVDTVAGTIFPMDLYAYPGFDYDPELDEDALKLLDSAAADLYECYVSMLDVLRTDTANRTGTYFGRMISWPGKTAGGTNQLADRITGLRRARRSNKRKRNVDDIAIGGEAEALDDDILGLQIYSARDRRERGFPCLVHVDFTLFDGRLSLAAVYRHQYLVTKAYGNLLGLARLLGFLAHQTGYEVGELVVNATLADAELGSYSKTRVDELISYARSAPS